MQISNPFLLALYAVISIVLGVLVALGKIPAASLLGVLALFLKSPFGGGGGGGAATGDPTLGAKPKPTLRSLFLSRWHRTLAGAMVIFAVGSVAAMTTSSTTGCNAQTAQTAATAFKDLGDGAALASCVAAKIASGETDQIAIALECGISNPKAVEDIASQILAAFAKAPDAGDARRMAMPPSDFELKVRHVHALWSDAGAAQ